MKKKKKVTRKKYATGTAIKNYIQDPSEVIAQNQMNIAEAKHAGGTNPLINMLKMAGNTTMQVGMKMGGLGEGFAGQLGNSVLGGTANQSFAYGSTVGGPPKEGFEDTHGIDPAVFSDADNFLQNHFLNPETNNRLRSNLESMGKDPQNSEQLLSSFISNAQGTKNHTAAAGAGPVKSAKGMFKNNSVTLYGADEENLSTAIHEKTHASGADKLLTDYINQNYGSPFTNKVNMIAKEKGYTELDSGNFSNGESTLSPKELFGSTFNSSMNAGAALNQLRYLREAEVYPRVQEARHLLNLEPGQEFTEGHLEQLKKHKGLKGLYENYEGETLKKMFNTVASNDTNMGKNKNIAAFGGTMKNVPVEIEGKEVGELPGGELFEATGPSHEAGGIPVSLPEGTEMYSKRIKVDGVTMAERKKGRKKRETALEDLLSEDSSDNLLKRTQKRTIKNNALENDQDEKIQSFVKNLVDPPKATHMFGDTVVPEYAGTGFNPNPHAFGAALPENFMALGSEGSMSNYGADISPMSGFVPTPSGVQSDPNKSIIGNKISQLGPLLKGGEGNGLPQSGDIVGMLGSLYSPFKQKDLTLQNRAGDTLNKNFYEDFGEAALETNANAQGQLDEIRDNKQQDLRLATNGAIRRGRNSSRGVNGQRATDLTAHLQSGQQNRTIHNEYSAGLLNLLQQKAQLQNTSELQQNRGEQGADIANRQDRDNFFSQLAQNESDIGAAYQNLGKDLNHLSEQDKIKNLLDQFSKYGLTFDKNLTLNSGK